MPNVPLPTNLKKKHPSKDMKPDGHCASPEKPPMPRYRVQQ